MMNKNLIQSSVRLPLVGDTNFFSKSLRFNLEIILFRKLNRIEYNLIKFGVNN